MLMKPTKKRPAKRTGNLIIDKLLKLKYRINDAYRSGNFDDAYNDTQVDKTWVMTLIQCVRENDLTKLSKEDMLKCNGLWSK